MSKITKKKYYEFMMELYELQEFDIHQMSISRQVGSRLSTVMRERNLIKRHGEVTRWIGEMPTQVMANLVTKECTRSSRMEKVIGKTPTNQMTIKPLKRVERIAPVRQPVQAEEQHTPYPVMDIVIAFLAGMIAAGFVSLIWK